MSGKNKNLLEAMAFLEAIEGEDQPREEIQFLSGAAHYLIQEYVTGHRPGNYNFFLAKAREISGTS